MQPGPLAEDAAAPTSPSVDERAGRRETVLGVLGVGLGLLLLLLAFVQLVGRRGGELDPGTLAGAWFPEGLPAGFEVASAHALPGGERTLRLVRTDDAADAGGPDELMLVGYPSNKGAEAAMRGGTKPGTGGPPGKPPEDPLDKLARWERERDFALHLTTERGELAWGAWRAPRATERSLRADGTWREAVRVNLSQPERFLVLFALWPPDVPAAPDALPPILRRVAMRTLEG